MHVDTFGINILCFFGFVNLKFKIITICDMKKYLLTLLLFIALPAYADCVVLLHGLARTSHSMHHLEKALSNENYQVVNQGYPSRQGSIDSLAHNAIPKAVKQCKSYSTIHFVTHSMGGILLRQYLGNNKIKKLGRVVMLGPPNQGSEVVDKLGNVPGFKLLNGTAGLQLGTDTTSVPNKLGPVDFDLGIIAGNRSINLLLSIIIPGADDGKVSIERTKLKGMNDHLVLPVTHTFMMRNKSVIHQIIFYLNNGYFLNQ